MVLHAWGLSPNVHFSTGLRELWLPAEHWLATLRRAGRIFGLCGSYAIGEMMLP